ncbi:FAD/NAD(P)-binding domain-containing protein [Annulohypoxylon truncatum]|uniref:FAD/NAD(P)-binding domain-containing protein n=1 Tax=Annulohypoxylon truncatum TaxID=327061 RepID=UPI0020089633|nr:FAD/NAD(P)-binding domain-containing protein [Annulohypoxylon truncatum]KAI1209037.1 FAD/NAD(P)-binding domain-containing protein [Annulohypoxylon truncatum]
MVNAFQPAIQLEVVVIGAGISGLAVAIETALSGHHVIVFEAADGLHEIGAGINISPNASRILRQWGLPAELWASATHPTSLSVRRYSGEILALEKDFDAKMRVRYDAPYIELHRVDFQTALYIRAKELGVEFRFGERVNQVNFETGKITTHSGLNAKGDIVVAADGLWSVCRAQFLPKDFEGVPRPTGDLAYRLVLTLDQIQDLELREWISKPSLDIWLGPHSHAVGYSLRGGTEFNIVLLVPDDLPAGISRQVGSVEEMRAHFTNWDPILTKFIAVADSVKKWKLMHRKEMRRWVYSSSNSNFAFLGDSCHPMLPYLGQGATSAIEDGAVLGRLLGHIQTKEQIGKALEMYEQLRKHRGDAIVKETIVQRDVFQIVDGPKQRERDELLLSQLNEETKHAPFPIRLLCPQFQPWLFGYDACAEVDKAVSKDSFVVVKDVKTEPSPDKSDIGSHRQLNG